ncbi:UDP-N-acetylmuramate dehydrogenase [Deferribacter desulfuricans SSM1]|uniref:UDP-N-acetylenolpyruvoylglucosamine reductase n=1 Tax=Deferribacter desulfuricans (strain DSM 14783 / JCM 11476 / NBRC 101012 / SSM1) TaxID=639282 RepID=D3PBJ6_DEFDS|nr:UDP-N-acetylmuramate dehydrogenase [Deferribacter desulfuricans]BAI79969.1 UDP-N-acetylmuramate dehydrogenase [Deferribacter desulfuricans SSM1]
MIILKDEILANYTSYRVGGKAKYFIKVINNDDVGVAINFAERLSMNYVLLGAGSNVLFMDEGFNGVVIYTGLLNRWMIEKDDYILVGAGVKLSELVEFSVERGVSGFEELAGIPGSVGGAVNMNAGAFNTEIKDVLTECVAYDMPRKKIINLSNADCKFGYRIAEGLKNRIVLFAKFKKMYGDKKYLKSKVDEILKKRDSKQPLEYPSCGSVFKRPKGDYAGRLIEECGLKGYRIGGAMVSEKHANFIVNLGNAKAKDILDLIEFVQNEVYKKFNILLEPEVKIIKN